MSDPEAFILPERVWRMRRIVALSSAITTETSRGETGPHVSEWAGEIIRHLPQVREIEDRLKAQ